MHRKGHRLYLGDAGVALDDAEQAVVGDAGAPEEVERAEPPARPVRQREERLVRDPVAERRLHGEAQPQERVPRNGVAEAAARARAGQQLPQPHVAQRQEHGGVRLARGGGGGGGAGRGWRRRGGRGGCRQHSSGRGGCLGEGGGIDSSRRQGAGVGTETLLYGAGGVCQCHTVGCTCT